MGSFGKAFAAFCGAELLVALSALFWSDELTDSAIAVLFWIFIFPLVVAIVVFVNSNSKEKEAAVQKEKRQKEQELWKSSAEKERNKSNFSVTKQEKTSDSIQTLAIDTNNKKWLITEGPRTSIYSYNQLVSYELYKDGNTVVDGRAGTAAVGGLLFGVTGAIVGASASRNVVNNCQSLYIMITTDTAVAHKIELIRRSTSENSEEYRQSINIARNMLSMLDVIKTYNNRGVNVQQSSFSSSNADEIKKYKELLDIGAISQEEFELKKNQLLK